jgi:hypothetical protein
MSIHGPIGIFTLTYTFQSLLKSFSVMKSYVSNSNYLPSMTRKHTNAQTQNNTDLHQHIDSSTDLLSLFLHLYQIGFKIMFTNDK